MNESQNMSITASLMIEYTYCPRFLYYMKVLDILQEEAGRFKVQKGREVHREKALTNLDYKRKKIEVAQKIVEEELYSARLQIHGKIDEVLILEDGSAAILDYKYAEFKDKVHETYRSQLTMYASLVEENYKVKVNKGYLVYTRSKNHLVEVEITEKDQKKLHKALKEIDKIINKNFYPGGTKTKSKCDDCCYSNICIK